MNFEPFPPSRSGWFMIIPSYTDDKDDKNVGVGGICSFPIIHLKF